MKHGMLIAGFILLAGAGTSLANPDFPDAQSTPELPSSPALPTVGSANVPPMAPTTGGMPIPSVGNWLFDPATGQPVPGTAAGPGEEHPHDLHEALAQRAEAIWSRPFTDTCCCWISPEYLLWSIKKGPVPLPVVTTGPLNTIGTATLFGPTDLNYGAFSGGRLTAGFWFDGHGGTIGLEASGFVLQKRAVQHPVASSATSSLPTGIPFFNTATRVEDFASFATPGATIGGIDVFSSSRLAGAESNFLFNLFRDAVWDVGVLAGFRYLNLQEDLIITGSTLGLPGQVLNFGGNQFGPGAITTTTDRFRVQNNFYGFQVGAHGRYRCGSVFLDLGGKFALGGTHEAVDIFGSSALLIGPTPIGTLPGGIFAQPTNIGRTTKNEFAIVPELELKLGYEFNHHWTAFVGYNFTYWSRVARPGIELNHQLSPSQPPTFASFEPMTLAMQPAPLFNTTDFWAQGLSVGLEFRY